MRFLFGCFEKIIIKYIEKYNVFSRFGWGLHTKLSPLSKISNRHVHIDKSYNKHE